MTACADPHPSGTLQCHLLRGQRSSLAMAQNIFETLLELIFFFLPYFGNFFKCGTGSHHQSRRAQERGRRAQTLCSHQSSLTISPLIVLHSPAGKLLTRMTRRLSTRRNFPPLPCPPGGKKRWTTWVALTMSTTTTGPPSGTDPA